MSNATSSGRATRPPAVEGGGGASGQAAGASNSKSSYVPFTPEEDEQLRALVEAHCESQGADAKPQWNLIAEKMPNRTGKSCRLRWINQLRDDLKKGGFTPEEDLTIMLGHAKHGNRWTLIAKDLPGRTDNAVKNRWHSTLHKRAQQQTELQQHLASAARLAADAGQAHGAALLTSLAQHAAKRPDLASQLHAKLLGSAPATNASSSTGVDAPALAASGGLGNGDGAGGRADGLVSGPTRGVGAARESSPGSAAGAGGGARRSAAGGGGGGGMGIEELMALIISVAPPGGDACDAAGAAAADLLDASAMAPALAPGAEQGGTQAAQEGGALPGRAAGGPRAGAGGGVGGPASRPPRVRHSATATPATASAGQVRKAAHRSQRLEAEEQAAGTGRASSGRASAESGQNVHERDRLALVVAAPSGLPPMPAVSAGAAGKALAARASTALTTPAALPPPQQTEEAMGVLTVPQPQPLPQPSQPPEPGCSATCSGHSVSRPLPPPPSLHLTPAGDVPASPTSAYTTEKGLLAALPTGLAALLTRITPEELSLWAQLKADDLPTLAVPPLQQEQRDGQQQQRGEGKARAWDGGCYLEPSAAPLPIAGSLLFGAQTAGAVTSLEVAVEAPGRAADGTSGPMAVTIDDPHESAVPDSAAGVVRRALPGKRTAAAVALAEELNEELGTEDEEDEEGDEEADQEEEEEEEEEPAVRPVSKRRRRGESAPMDTGPPALPPAGTGEHGAAASGATRLHPLPPALPLSQAPAGVASAPPVHATGTHPPWGQGAATLPIHGPTPPPPPTQAGLPAGPALMPPHTPQPLPDLPSLSLIWDLGFRAWLASGGADGLAAPAPHLAAPCSYPAAPHLHPQPHGMGTHGPMAASAPHLHPQPHASMAASAPHLLAAIESALGPWGASDPQLLSLITRGGPWAHQPSPALAPPPQQPPHAAGGLHCSAPYGGGASAAHAMEMKAHPGMPLHYHPDALHHQQPPQQHPQPAHHPSRNTPSLSSASHAALAQLFSSQQHLPQLPWEAQPDAAMPNPEGSGMLPGMVAGPVPRVESAAMLGTPLNGSLGELMSMWAAAGAHAAPGGLFPAAAPPADPPADTLAGAGGLPPHAGPGGFPGMEGMGFPAASVSLAQAAMTGMDRPAGSLSPPAMPPHDGAPGLRRSGSFPVAPHQAGLPGSWPPSLAGSLGDLLALVAPGGPPTTPPTSPAGQY